MDLVLGRLWRLGFVLFLWGVLGLPLSLFLVFERLWLVAIVLGRLWCLGVVLSWRLMVVPTEVLSIV